MRADSDEKYIVVVASGDTGDAGAYVEDLDSSDLRKLAIDCGQNKDGDTVKAALWDDGTMYPGEFYVVNTSGAIVKNKTAAKDGDDWYFYVDDKNLAMYTNNKTLKDDPGKGYVMDINLENWKNWAPGVWPEDPDEDGISLSFME